LLRVWLSSNFLSIKLFLTFFKLSGVSFYLGFTFSSLSHPS
jgi:hypothetical protein